MPCGRSADIYLSGDAIAKCGGNHVGVFVTYVPQLKGSSMFINKHNDLLVRCVNGKNVKLNVQFFDNKDNKDGDVITSNIILPSSDFANYPTQVEWHVQKIDAVCDKDYAPVGILFGPDSKLAAAFKEVLKKRGVKVSELPPQNSTWTNVFGGASYTCDAEAEELPGLFDRLVSILKNLGYIQSEYKCKETGGEKTKHHGGAKKCEKKDNSIKSLLQKLNTLVDKI